MYRYDKYTFSTPIRAIAEYEGGKIVVTDDEIAFVESDIFRNRLSPFRFFISAASRVYYQLINCNLVQCIDKKCEINKFKGQSGFLAVVGDYFVFKLSTNRIMLQSESETVLIIVENMLKCVVFNDILIIISDKFHVFVSKNEMKIYGFKFSENSIGIEYVIHRWNTHRSNDEFESGNSQKSEKELHVSGLQNNQLSTKHVFSSASNETSPFIGGLKQDDCEDADLSNEIYNREISNHSTDYSENSDFNSKMCDCTLSTISGVDSLFHRQNCYLTKKHHDCVSKNKNNNDQNAYKSRDKADFLTYNNDVSFISNTCIPNVGELTFLDSKGLTKKKAPQPADIDRLDASFRVFEDIDSIEKTANSVLKSKISTFILSVEKLWKVSKHVKDDIHAFKKDFGDFFNTQCSSAYTKADSEENGLSYIDNYAGTMKVHLNAKTNNTNSHYNQNEMGTNNSSGKVNNTSNLHVKDFRGLESVSCYSNPSDHMNTALKYLNFCIMDTDPKTTSFTNVQTAEHGSESNPPHPFSNSKNTYVNTNKDIFVSGSLLYIGYLVFYKQDLIGLSNQKIPDFIHLILSVCSDEESCKFYQAYFANYDTEKSFKIVDLTVDAKTKILASIWTMIIRDRSEIDISLLKSVLKSLKTNCDYYHNIALFLKLCHPKCDQDFQRTPIQGNSGRSHENCVNIRNDSHDSHDSHLLHPKGHRKYMDSDFSEISKNEASYYSCDLLGHNSLQKLLNQEASASVNDTYGSYLKNREATTNLSENTGISSKNINSLIDTTDHSSLYKNDTNSGKISRSVFQNDQDIYSSCSRCCDNKKNNFQRFSASKNALRNILGCFLSTDSHSGAQEFKYCSIYRENSIKGFLHLHIIKMQENENNVIQFSSSENYTNVPVYSIIDDYLELCQNHNCDFQRFTKNSSSRSIVNSNSYIKKSESYKKNISQDLYHQNSYPLNFPYDKNSHDLSTPEPLYTNSPSAAFQLIKKKFECYFSAHTVNATPKYNNSCFCSQSSKNKKATLLGGNYSTNSCQLYDHTQDDLLGIEIRRLLSYDEIGSFASDETDPERKLEKTFCLKMAACAGNIYSDCALNHDPNFVGVRSCEFKKEIDKKVVRFESSYIVHKIFDIYYNCNTAYSYFKSRTKNRELHYGQSIICSVKEMFSLVELPKSTLADKISSGNEMHEILEFSLDATAEDLSYGHLGFLIGCGLAKKFKFEQFVRLSKTENDYSLMCLFISIGFSLQGTRDQEFKEVALKKLRESPGYGTSLGICVSLCLVFENTNDYQTITYLSQEICKKGAFTGGSNKGNKAWYDDGYRSIMSIALSRVITDKNKIPRIDNRLCHLIVSGCSLICTNKKIFADIIYRDRTASLEEIFLSTLFEKLITCSTQPSELFEEIDISFLQTEKVLELGLQDIYELSGKLSYLIFFSIREKHLKANSIRNLDVHDDGLLNSNPLNMLSTSSSTKIFDEVPTTTYRQHYYSKISKDQTNKAITPTTQPLSNDRLPKKDSLCYAEKNKYSQNRHIFSGNFDVKTLLHGCEVSEPCFDLDSRGKDLNPLSSATLEALLNLALNIEQLMEKNIDLKFLFHTVLIVLSFEFYGTKSVSLIRILRRLLLKSVDKHYISTIEDFVIPFKDQSQYFNRYGDFVLYKLCLGLVSAPAHARISFNRVTVVNVISAFFFKWPLCIEDDLYSFFLRYLFMGSIVEYNDVHRVPNINLLEEIDKIDKKIIEKTDLSRNDLTINPNLKLKLATIDLQSTDDSFEYLESLSKDELRTHSSRSFDTQNRELSVMQNESFRGKRKGFITISNPQSFDKRKGSSYIRNPNFADLISQKSDFSHQITAIQQSDCMIRGLSKKPKYTNRLSLKEPRFPFITSVPNEKSEPNFKHRSWIDKKYCFSNLDHIFVKKFFEADCIQKKIIVDSINDLYMKGVYCDDITIFRILKTFAYKCSNNI